jgi:hypothetical protein
LEQILLYIVTISGFSGFMLGLYSLLIPVLQRRGIHLPFASREPRGQDDYDFDVDDPDTREFAAASFSARRTSLLERLPRRAAPRAEPQDQEGQEEMEEEASDDEEMLGDLDLTKERAEVQAEDEEDYEEDELAELTFEAEVDPVLDELAEDDKIEEADAEDDQAEEGDDEEEYEDEEEEEQAPEQPVVQVVTGGGGDDMLALFSEASDAVKEVEAWREDLPNPTIEELLAEAQQLRALFGGERPRE